MSLETLIPRDLYEFLKDHQSAPKSLSEFLAHPTNMLEDLLVQDGKMSQYTREKLDEIKLRILLELSPRISTLDQNLVYEALDYELETGAPRVDQLCGITFGTLMEICGDPGSGKTQLAMTTCASAVSNEMTVLWYDTQHSFQIDRFCQILKRFGADETQSLKRVSVRNCFSLEYLLFDLYQLCVKLEKDRNSIPFLNQLRVIVIDSITTLVLPNLGNNDCVRLLGQCGHLMKIMASEFNLAILVTNYSVSKSSSVKEKEPKPALGEFTWGHIPTKRVLLQIGQNYGEEMRTIQVHKYLFNLGNRTQYRISEKGFGGLENTC